MRLPVILRMVLFWILVVGLAAPVGAQIVATNGKHIDSAEMDAFVKSQMASQNMPGLSIAVIQNGSIIYERAFGIADVAKQTPVNEATIFEAASLSKPVFAWFTMRQVEKGLLNLDRPLYLYLPYPDIDYDDRYKLITARMALCHTTGFPNWRSENEGADLSLKFTPGTKYSYSGEGYQYLAHVVALVTHKSIKTLDELIQDEEAKPLGMAHSSYVANDYVRKHKATGYYDEKNEKGDRWFPIVLNAASSLQTNAPDYARFLIGIMNEKTLQKTTIDEMLRPQVSIPEEGKQSTSSYGLGFAIQPTKYGTKYSHSGQNGNFSSDFQFFREQKFGFVFFTNCGREGEFEKRLSALLME